MLIWTNFDRHTARFLQDLIGVFSCIWQNCHKNEGFPFN